MADVPDWLITANIYAAIFTPLLLFFALLALSRIARNIGTHAKAERESANALLQLGDAIRDAARIRNQSVQPPSGPASSMAESAGIYETEEFRLD